MMAVKHRHKPGQCQGWHSAVYTKGQCRICWQDKNPQTRTEAPQCTTIGCSTSDGVRVKAEPLQQHQPISLPLRPPCVHLGDISYTCSNTLQHRHHCLNENQPLPRCWRSPHRPAERDVQSCQSCEYYQSGRMTFAPGDGQATICITHWLRPEALERCLKSIALRMSDYPVITEDTGGNLSRGRNRLAERCPTEYYIMMEEDFVVLPETPKRIREAIDILNHDRAIAGVGGTCLEHPQRKVWGHNYDRRGNHVRITSSQRQRRSTPSGITYRPCDLVLNWGVFRTELYRRVPWDEDFVITEHKAYYWTASQAGAEFAFYPPLTIRHLRDRPSHEYRVGRHRNLAGLTVRKFGFSFEGGHV